MAEYSVVFAQLSLDGTSFGIHGFLVRLRDGQGRVCTGIRLADCGAKMGIDGVDNGRIWFNNYRIPRSSLLDRFGQVSKEGRYSTNIKDNDSRFAAHLVELIAGRIGVATGAVQVAKLGLTVGLRCLYS